MSHRSGRSSGDGSHAEGGVPHADDRFMLLALSNALAERRRVEARPSPPHIFRLSQPFQNRGAHHHLIGPTYAVRWNVPQDPSVMIEGSGPSTKPPVSRGSAITRYQRTARAAAEEVPQSAFCRSENSDCCNASARVARCRTAPVPRYPLAYQPNRRPPPTLTSRCCLPAHSDRYTPPSAITATWGLS